MKQLFYILVIAFLASNNILRASKIKEKPYGVFKSKDAMQEYNKKVFTISNRHKFNFTGYIVDGKNKPINDVKMEISLSKNAWTWRGNKYVITSSGNKFDTTTAKCRSASIKFIKKGYYPAYVSASYLDIAKKKLKYDFQYDGTTIKARNIKVVMMSIGEIPKLLRANILETISIKYSNGNFKLHAVKIPGPLYSRDKYQDFTVKNIKQLSLLLPKDVVYIIPEMTLNKVKIQEEYFDSTAKAKGKIKVPASITLKSNYEKGGFILVKNPSEEYQFRTMQEAPKAGYKKEIVLTKFPHNGSLKRIYFYFKVNNCYGKIMITSIEVYPDGSGVALTGWLVINPVPNERNINSYQQNK
jgi:hypothetical protein